MAHHSEKVTHPTLGGHGAGAALMVVLLFIGVATAPLVVRLDRDCLLNWDLGIYAQALYRLGWSNPNPWLSVREVRIFNDHVDPVLFLVAPLAKWMEPALAAILIESVFFVLAAGFIYVFLRRQGTSIQTALLCMSLVLFSSGALKAVRFPAHPTAWAIFPLMALMASLAKGSVRAALPLAFSLLLFKEEFAFSVWALGAFFWWRRDRKASLALLGVSTVWGIGVFVLRPWFWGPVVTYDAELFRPWFQNFNSALRQTFWNLFTWRDILHLVVPFVPLWIWMRRERLPANWAALVVFAPAALIRVLAAKWGDHYGVIATAGLVGFILPAVLTAGKIPSWAAASTLALLALMQGQWLFQNVRQAFEGSPPKCPSSAERGKEIAEAHRILKFHPEELVVAENNLIPRLVTRNQIHHLGIYSPPLGQSFFLLYEQEPAGDSWPLPPTKLRELCARYQSTAGSAPLLDGRWVQLWKIGGSSHRQ